VRVGTHGRARGSLSDNIVRMRNIYLVGFMGAGKSSVGAALAARLGYRFIDLDERLRERFEVSIPEVFVVRGEDVFREAETEELSLVAGEPDVVVATGGGTFCSEVNREIISGSNGVSVYLDLSWEELDRRLVADNSGRPKYDDAEQARSLYEERQPEYRRADVVIALKGSENPDEVADQVLEALREEAACAI
jgi:shikimate kinase